MASLYVRLLGGFEAQLTSGQAVSLRGRKTLEPLIECRYMRREYAEAIEAFNLWRDPPFYMFDVLAACHAQLGHTEEARTARDFFLRACPETYDTAIAVEAHLRMIKRQEDRDHWLEGYRKAGVEV